MSWLATRFIFELIGVGAALDLNEPQAFENFSFQMMVYRTVTFRHIFHKKLYHFQVFYA